MITIIQEDLKQAMRDKDSTKLNVLRALKTAISNASLQKGNIDSTISDTEILAIIRKEISKRQDSIQAFQNAKREDLSSKESLEIEYLNKYLPQALSQDEVDMMVKNSILELGATSKKDMGKVIKRVQELSEGRVDNKTISSTVGLFLP